MARFYNFYRERVPLDIWGVAARAAGRRANGLFFSLNHGCFDGEGRLSKPELFRFSEGSLALPPGLRVEALGERRFRVAWEQESERASCAPTDRLVVGVIPDDPRLIVYLAEGPEARRRDGEGTFSLRERPAVGSRVYVFFAREDGGAFSPSACFPVRY